jgi:small-conductance mechanosensitive channel
MFLWKSVNTLKKTSRRLRPSVCNHVRLHIPIGIAYESDLKKAKALALSAATSIDRILKVPEPKCLVMEYGDSTVNLELRVWIDDPKNGIDNVKDAVLLAFGTAFMPMISKLPSRSATCISKALCR